MNFTPAQAEQTLRDLCVKACDLASVACDKKEDYDILEDNKKELFAAITDKMEAKTTAEKERKARLSREWQDYVSGLQAARRAARLAIVNRDNVVRQWETCRSILSSLNSEKRMVK